MQSISPAWLTALGCLLLAMAVTTWKSGPARALGVGVVLSFLFPCWLKAQIFGLPFDLRTTAAAVGLVVFAVHPRGRLFEKVVWLDLCLVALVIIHTASEVVHGASYPLAILGAYGEWALPYAAGRYAIRSPADINSLAKWMSAVGVLLAAVCVCESLTGINFLESYFGARPVDPLLGDAPQRQGFMRSIGNAHHPVFMGVTFLMFLPWTAQLVAASREWLGRSLGVCACFLILAGQLATLTRGAVLATLTIPVVAIGFLSRRAAVLSTVAVLFVGVCFALNWEAVDEYVHDIGGENVQNAEMIEVGGKLVPYTSVRARLYVLEIWAPVLKHTGLLGAGSAATKAFPPNVPGVRERLQTIKLLPFVDNAYILHGLRFGWLGLGALALTLIVGLAQTMMLRQVQGVQTFVVFMASLILVFAALMMIVWLCYDFAFLFLWNLGIVSGLMVEQLRGWSMDDDPYFRDHRSRR